jgi:hypothetical protein
VGGALDVGNRKATDRRIWRVRYALVAENALTAPLTLAPPDAIIAALSQALSELLTFCRDRSWRILEPVFRKRKTVWRQTTRLRSSIIRISPRKVCSVCRQRGCYASCLSGCLGIRWNGMVE